MSQRMLVMRSGALGDFILGLPALRALRETFPTSRLELIAPATVLPLAAGLVDVATPIERAEIAAFFGDAELPAAIGERYAGLDLAVLWLTDADGAVRGHFERLGTRRVVHAPALPPRDARIHATDYLLETLRPLGITGKPRHPSVGRGLVPRRPASAGGVMALQAVPTISPDPTAVENARLTLAKLDFGPGLRIVAIHPGSGGKWKCWPPERFARIVDLLHSSGRDVVLIEGPADGEAVAQVLARVEGTKPPVISGLATGELAGLLSLCATYLGNDSGVTHLAAAVGAPTIALFGPTDPAVWGPRGIAVTILRGEEGRMEAITVEQVVPAVNTLRSESARRIDRPEVSGS